MPSDGGLSPSKFVAGIGIDIWSAIEDFHRLLDQVHLVLHPPSAKSAVDFRLDGFTMLAVNRVASDPPHFRIEVFVRVDPERIVRREVDNGFRFLIIHRALLIGLTANAPVRLEFNNTQPSLQGDALASPEAEHGGVAGMPDLPRRVDFPGGLQIAVQH
ncbi:hypothetical protein AMC83_PA00011 (plasmid) [Rhizobium phaseoli]|nr:hypothetical protein AMC83_PA00011 [Rhizobium phaseoli]